MRIFIDLEFSGLHQQTTPISIGLVDENDNTFYGEFLDYMRGQVDRWIQTNVVDHLLLANLNFKQFSEVSDEIGGTVVCGTKKNIVTALWEWLKKYDSVEIWGDVVSYDWVVFCELFGGARNIPANIYYIPFDLATLFKIKGYDPDLNRENFVGATDGLPHNSLYDAKIIKQCYETIMGK